MTAVDMELGLWWGNGMHEGLHVYTGDVYVHGRVSMAFRVQLRAEQTPEAAAHCLDMLVGGGVSLARW